MLLLLNYASTPSATGVVGLGLALTSQDDNTVAWTAQTTLNGAAVAADGAPGYTLLDTTGAVVASGQMVTLTAVGWYYATVTSLSDRGHLLRVAALISDMEAAGVAAVQNTIELAAATTIADAVRTELTTELDEIGAILDDTGTSGVLLASVQGAVQFGQVKILADVEDEGALYIVNSHAMGIGQYNTGQIRGLYNVGLNGSGVVNDGSIIGQYNYGNAHGQYNEGGDAAVLGVDPAGIRSAIGMAAADLDTQLAALPTATENSLAVLAAMNADPPAVNVTYSAGVALSGRLAEAAEVEALLLDLETPLEGAMTLGEALRVMLAALAGASSGGRSSTLRFKSLDGATDRIVATVDGQGNRKTIALDGTA